MYESPINQILGEMQITYENECMKAVQSVGFDVNKEELTKALAYDRNQYEKGYSDGYNKAIDDFFDEALYFENYIEPIDTSEFGATLLYSGVDISNMIVKIKEELAK